jgi:hypothetical protein
MKLRKELLKKPAKLPKNIGTNFESVEEHIGLDKM